MKENKTAYSLYRGQAPVILRVKGGRVQLRVVHILKRTVKNIENIIKSGLLIMEKIRFKQFTF
jgi:hypothetical protein